MRQTTRIRKNIRKVAIGDMVDRITIYNRTMTPPVNGSVDFTENFTGPRAVWACVNTVSGKTFFDSTNTEHVVTHEIHIRWLTGITSESWIDLIDGTRLKILPTEDFEIRKDFMLLKCTERGPNSKAVNQA